MNNNLKPFFLPVFLLSFIGIVANYLSISLLAPIQLIFTPAFLILSLRLLPLKAALTVIVVVLAHLSWYWGSFYNTLLYSFELGMLLVALKRNWNLYYVDIAYWALVGIPLAYLLLFIDGHQDTISNIVILLKQPFNGLLCILLSSLMVWIIRFAPIDFNIEYKEKNIGISAFISDVLMLILLVPTFLILVLFKNTIDERSVQNIFQHNHTNAFLTKNRIQDFLNSYRQAIENLSLQIASDYASQSEDAQQQLSEFHSVYDGFITMLVADKEGRLVMSSPAHLIEKGVEVSDRDYFYSVKNNLQPFLSNAFQGRGFGQDPIVAISAPLLDDNGSFLGIVEGSLNIYKFDLLMETSGNYIGEILILDEDRRVIMATPGLQLSFLQTVEIKLSPNELFEQVLSFYGINETFAYGHSSTENGWEVYFLTNVKAHSDYVSRSYLWLISIALLAMLVTLVFSNAMAKLARRPILKLIDRFESMELNSGAVAHVEPEYHFYELNLLFEKFNQNYDKLIDAYSSKQQALSDKISAEKASEAKTELLSKVSHELRTPLNAILGQAQLLLMESTSSKNEQLNQIIDAGKYLVSLIDDLLELSKSESGTLHIQSEVTELNEIIERVVLLFEGAFKKQLLSFALDIDATQGVRVLVDPTRLQQVCVNLLSNAIKYNKPQGKVILKTKLINSEVEVRFIDTGLGIPVEYYPKVFQPFQRLAQEHGQIEGSGIGLSLSYRLVTQMGGKLRFISEQNVGSEFYFSFPIERRTKNRQTETKSSGKINLSSYSIFYIEDNATNYLILDAWLKKQGAKMVAGAKTGEEALNKLSHLVPDLIFLDLGLPDISGLELILSLRNMLPKTPIVALTAHNS